MTEEESNSGEGTRDKIASITANDVIKFFAEKQISPACQICGKDEWDIASPDGAGTAELELGKANAPKDGGQSKKEVPFVAMACINCGYLRFHAAALFVYWKYGEV